jgi:hypothetical protein
LPDDPDGLVAADPDAENPSLGGAHPENIDARQ